MSALGDFVKAAIAVAFPTIGTSLVSIGGGVGVACVLNEKTYSDEMQDSGFAPLVQHNAVIPASVFLTAYTAAPKSYIGRTAVIGGEKFRVNTVTVGSEHVIIALATINRS